jgi:hypothetical protein
MRNIVLLLAIISLVGGGCKISGNGAVTTEKIRQALEKTAEDYGWAKDVIGKGAFGDSVYVNSHLLYGPSKSSGLENLVDSIEVMKFASLENAEKNYKSDKCFKGNGIPFMIYGVGGCCLNDIKNKNSAAIIMKDEFIFKSSNYFFDECRAVKYLKKFWKNLYYPKS